MHSAGEEAASAERRTRLSTRVILSAMASGALAGTLAAVCTVVAVDHLESQRADQRLMGVAEVLGGEIDEGSEEEEWEPLEEVVADENAELVTSGIRLAVFAGSLRVAGERWVPRVSPGRCETHGVVGARARACARQHGGWTLVAAVPRDDAAQRLIYVIAALGSLVVGAGMGALASIKLTGWALLPLTSLSDAIRSARPDRADAEALGPRSDCEEVEVIRDALADLLGRSEALLSQAQRFAADAAHELRTPLTLIRAELELLIEDAAGDQDRAALARLSARTRRLEELVERLLVLASPLERLREASEAVSMADIVQEAVADLPDELRPRVRVEARGEGALRGEPALLRSMVANAIDNALKFSGDEPVDVTIEELGTGGRGSPVEVRVDVRDLGPGVARERRERVFEPFYREAPSAAPGHGLGLSLIGHVARAHGGEAAFLDAERGAWLRIVLPAWQG